MKSLFRMGFGFVEVGTVTPLPQPGNPKPRLYRLVEDKGFINRFGFNNEGQSKILKRVKKYWKKPHESGILGINIGKNKLTEDGVIDYIKGIRNFGSWGNYIVINISSPNTPGKLGTKLGLRNLQNKENLVNLLTEVIQL